MIKFEFINSVGIFRGLHKDESGNLELTEASNRNKTKKDISKAT